MSAKGSADANGKRKRPRRTGAWAGLAAGVAGLAASFALRDLGGVFLPELLAHTAIETAPGKVGHAAMQLLGDPVATIGGTTVALAGILAGAAVLGIVYDRLRRFVPGRSAVRRGLLFAVVPLGLSGAVLGLVAAWHPELLTAYSPWATGGALVVLSVVFGVVLGLLGDPGTDRQKGSAVARVVGSRPSVFATASLLLALALTVFVIQSLIQGRPAARTAESAAATPSADQSATTSTRPHVSHRAARSADGGCSPRATVSPHSHAQPTTRAGLPATIA
jgi:hypothetical protein